MAYFEGKMYQIRFRLELRPRPGWGSLQKKKESGREKEGEGRVGAYPTNEKNRSRAPDQPVRHHRRMLFLTSSPYFKVVS